MKKGTRMIDIAESLNISVVTVSNALNNRGGVSPELREMIKKIADEIGVGVPTLKDIINKLG